MLTLGEMAGGEGTRPHGVVILGKGSREGQEGGGFEWGSQPGRKGAEGRLAGGGEGGRAGAESSIVGP